MNSITLTTIKASIRASALALLLAFGCASPDHIKDNEGHIKSGDSTKITLGMSKLEVMRALGKPETTSADGTGETLFYRLERPWWQDKPFKVQLNNDKVTSFGIIESPK
jgi:outer membrane protein assembly factor BamE (lipoprotein component of BamABCDE complex)